MKYLYIAMVIIFALWAGDAVAACGTITCDSEEEIDAGEETDEGPGVGRRMDRVGVMQPGQMYDPNTGLPNMVPSDATGELDSQ